MSIEHEDATHPVEDHSHDDMNITVIVGYLLTLTAATFLNLYLHKYLWGSISNALIVLMIGVCKATLVVGFFMHFRYEKSWKYFLTIPPCILGVVAIFALLPDVAFGTYPPVVWVMGR